jgi:hypothetical protein
MVQTDLFNASAKGIEGTMVWRSDRTRVASTRAPTDSVWFNAFMTGHKARVGERRKQDVAISIGLVTQFRTSLQFDWDEALARGDQVAL